jgi:4-hydroxythreonine-4-phosphate dehydrogenase
MPAMTTSLPTVAITVGDPAGIGPEVTVKALNDPAVRTLARYVVFGDRRLWFDPSGRSLAEFDFATLPCTRFTQNRQEGGTGVTLVEFPEIDYTAIPVGQATPAGGEASIRYLLAAIDAMKAGRLDAVATGPINKAAIHEAGYPWPGHTELFAEKFSSGDVAMMFAGGPFRVVLATIHMSLADVLRTLSADGILRTIRLANTALQRFFAIHGPRIAVCGLNPHAGEGGRFGNEESRTVTPAIERARAEGIDAIGPLPADTVYRAAMKGRYDIIVAMYHDQGLIPIKTVAFEESVNITIGIPAIRTSVDHGTAFDIAGRGLADPSSMKSAIAMAVRMYQASRA